MDNITILEMTPKDFECAFQLWKNSPGISLSSADSKENITTFLRLNPGLCFTARDGNKLVGAVLCGSDGRRGYLYHLAVAPAYQNLGIGKALADRVLKDLRERGIQRCHIFVMADNTHGKKFWQKTGWKKRDELFIMSHDL